MAYTAEERELFLKCLEKNLGIVSDACTEMGVGRTTHYQWMNEPDYAARVDLISEIALDFGESHLFKQISQDNPTSTIFFLKCRGRERGYRERDAADALQKTTIDVSDRLAELIVNNKG